MEPAKADREYPLGEIIIKTGKESQEDMADTRTDELYRALQDKGYPDELCREIAYKHMNTDYTATRMLGETVSTVKSISSVVCFLWVSPSSFSMASLTGMDLRT